MKNIINFESQIYSRMKSLIKLFITSKDTVFFEVKNTITIFYLKKV